MRQFLPTWLYIKQHDITGLKYFGKTTRDPMNYNGSGIHWTRHLKKHGKMITTVWCQLFYDKNELINYATAFSKENQIVESDQWANLKDENGLDGGRFGPRSESDKLISSKANKGRTAWNKGVPREQYIKDAVSDANKGRTAWNKGSARTDEDKNKMKAGWSKKKEAGFVPHNKGMLLERLVCPHCAKVVGGRTNFNRWHGDNCKNAT